VRLRVDRREGHRPGEKYAHWELRGVPLRIVVGSRDLAEGSVSVVRRLDGQEQRLPLAEVGERLPGLLEEVQQLLRERAQRLLEDRSREVSSLDGLRAAFEEGPVFANAPFCDRPDCEAAVKAAVHAVTVRCLRFDRSGEGRPCLVCTSPAEHIAVIARAY
jgi:prolyl-tRNA synthetase